MKWLQRLGQWIEQPRSNSRVRAEAAIVTFALFLVSAASLHGFGMRGPNVIVWGLASAMLLMVAAKVVLTFAFERQDRVTHPTYDHQHQVLRIGKRQIPFEEIEVRIFRYSREEYWIDEPTRIPSYEVYLRTREMERFPLGRFNTEREANAFAQRQRKALERHRAEVPEVALQEQDDA